MKKSFNLLAVIIVSAIVVTGITGIITSEDGAVIMTADALPPSNCTVQNNIPSERGDMAFHMPQGIPETHELRDNFVDTGFVDLYFAKEPMCQQGVDAQTFEDGLIRYFEANSDSVGFSVEINGGAERLELLYETTDYPDRVSLGQINGMSALFIESGMRKTIVTDEETNEVIDTFEDYSPSEIRVVDEKNSKYYTIIADLPLSQLKTIMQKTLK